MGLDMIKGTIDDSVGLLRRYYKELFIDFLKIYLLYFLFAILALIPILGFFIVNPSEEDHAMRILLLAVAVIAYFAAIIVYSAIFSVGYVITKNRAENSKVVSILGKAKELLFPIGRYSILTWLIMLLLFVPPMAFYLAIGNGGGLVFLLLTVLSLIALVVFMFLIQFSMLEIAVAGKGAIEGIKESTRKVRSKVFPVLGLDIMLLVVAFVVSTVFMMITQVVAFLLLSYLPDLLVLVIAVLLIGAVMIIQYVVTAMFIIPMQYFFWKRIR